MDCHIVPQVYQRKWRTALGKNNVIYYDKNDIINGVPGNVSKHMFEVDYYIPNIYERSYFTLKYTRQIEEALDKNFENYYNNLVDLFLDFKRHYYENPKEIIQGIKIEDLVSKIGELDLMKEFLIVQHFRRFENAEIYIKKHINNFLPYIPKAINKRELTLKQYHRAVWKASLSDYSKTNKLNIADVLVKQLKDFTFILLFTDGQEKFILSDNPVVFNIGDNIDSNLPEGIFSPLTPEILLCLVKLEDDDSNKKNILMRTAQIDFLKYFNSVLLNRSFKEIGYIDSNVSTVINNNNPGKF